MTPFKVHIIHVGSMANKGTQALLMSDISVIKEIVKGDVTFSVSTTDVQGVKQLNLPIAEVLPYTIDIPYEKADNYAKSFGLNRDTLRYKFFALGGLISMPIAILLSLISAILVKFGLKGFYRNDVLERVRDCSLVISYSDENFKEGASLLPLNIYWLITWWSMMIPRTWEILIAKFLGKPVIMFPNSVGSFRTWIGRLLSKLALNRCDRILVREPASYKIVESLGIRTPKILTTDTTLLLGSMCDPPPRKKSGNPVVGVSPGIYSRSLSKKEVDKYIMAHVEALDTAIEKHGFSVVFLPHYVTGFRYDDLEISEIILSKMKNADKARIVNTNRVEEFKELMGGMDLVISSKMHPSVFAISACVPTLNIAYDHKQTGFFESFGMSDCVIKIDEISSDKLWSKIDNVWKRKDSLETSIRATLPLEEKQLKRAIMIALDPFVEAKC